MDRPVGKLIVVGGKEDGRTFVLTYGETTVGRGPEARILLDDEPPFVSRVHCVFRATASGVTVTDLDSTNGILVNGKKTKDAVLGNHDAVQIGSFTLHFVAAGDAATLATAGR
jgi:adenylate cyclase